MDEKKVPKQLRIGNDMRVSYSSLELSTPFSKWAASKLWAAIEKEKRGENQ